MAVLKIKRNGEWVSVGIGAQGPRGPRGPSGSGTGDMLMEIYDPNCRETDVFAYVDTANIDCGYFTDAAIAN